MKLSTCVLLVCACLSAGCKSPALRGAIVEYQNANYLQAIVLANDVLAEDPGNAEAHFTVALAYSEVDSVDLAYRHFTQSAELDPKRAAMARDNIQSNFARHHNHALSIARDPNADLPTLNQAAGEYERATEADPTNAVGFFKLGKTYSRMGESETAYYEQAVGALERALEIGSSSDKHYNDALRLAATLHAKTGDAERATSRFKELVDKEPTAYPVVEHAGYESLDQKKWLEAARFLELSASAREQVGAADFQLYNNIGFAHFQTRKVDVTSIDRAVEFYKKALELKPDEPVTTLNIVKAYYAAEAWTQAVTWGERYASLQPEDKDAWRFLARIYSELGDKEKARQCSERYRTLSE